MNTLNRSLSFDSRLLHLYRPLIIKLLVLLGCTIVLIGATLLYYDQKRVAGVSETVIRNSTDATSEHVKRLFDSSLDSLLLARGQLASHNVGDAADNEAIVLELIPFLTTYESLDSINLADTDNNEIALLRDGEDFLLRTSNESDPGHATWRRLQDGAVVEEWRRAVQTPPSERPWFVGAMSHEEGARYWTEPYSFLTTGEAGISVSTKWRSAEAGKFQVVAFNTSLAAVSQHSIGHRPSKNGITVIFGNAGRTIGLPFDERFDDEQSVRAASLMPVAELGLPNLDAAWAAWDARQRPEDIFKFDAPDGPIWAGFARIQLDDEHQLWSATLIPESDLHSGQAVPRNVVLGGIAFLGALVGAALLGISLRSIRRQMKGAVENMERKLGQYRIEQKIGQGGNGAVFRARHALLRRPTALKLMSPEFANSEAARERFEHEVRLTSSLSHPNTVSIYDFGRTADGTLYYAMELLDGSTMARLVRISGPLPGNRVIHLLQQVCGSLAEAHSRGLIHRDIKPSNVIVCERGGLYDVVKVLDFGLVKEMAEVDGDLTQADVLIGTPFFMAPETISEPGRASPQSDLYALGAVGYFLLTGVNVFEGGSAVEICAAHLHDEPVPPSQRVASDVPKDLEQILLGCLAKDPADRPADAAALGELLWNCADAGTWTQADARQWWQANASGLSTIVAADDDVPMSRTELLIDLDSRLLTRGAGPSVGPQAGEPGTS